MVPTIDYATAADATALEALFRAVVAPLELYNRAARAEQLAHFTAAEFGWLIAADARSVILARFDGAPAGFAIVEDEHGPVWLEWYGVAAEARTHGETRVWCDMRTDNVGSNALLVRLGFRQLCRLDRHWHGQDYFLWDLSPL